MQGHSQELAYGPRALFIDALYLGGSFAADVNASLYKLGYLIFFVNSDLHDVVGLPWRHRTLYKAILKFMIVFQLSKNIFLI